MTRRRVTPEAFLVARYDTPREQWLKLRRQGIGGSDALAAIGMDRWKTRLEVWLDKTGRMPDWEGNDRTRWGQMVEDVIVQWFTEQTGVKTRRCGLLRNADRPWQQVSVDRLSADGGLVEVKNRNWHRVHEWDRDQVDDGAEAQGQHGLAVTGLTHAWCVAQLAGEPPVIRRVERNDLLIADMTAMEAQFWQMVQDGTPPALEGPAAPALVKRLFPGAETGKVIDLDDAAMDLLREARRALNAESAAGRGKDEAYAKVQMALGDAEFARYQGRLVATWKNEPGRRSTDYDVLEDRYPAAYADTVSRTPGRRFLSKLTDDDIADDAAERKAA